MLSKLYCYGNGIQQLSQKSPISRAFRILSPVLLYCMISKDESFSVNGTQMCKCQAIEWNNGLVI